MLHLVEIAASAMNKISMEIFILKITLTHPEIDTKPISLSHCTKDRKTECRLPRNIVEKRLKSQKLVKLLWLFFAFVGIHQELF